jgi:hypothetical protein
MRSDETRPGWSAPVVAHLEPHHSSPAAAAISTTEACTIGGMIVWVEPVATVPGQRLARRN